MLPAINLSIIIEYISSCERPLMQAMWKIYDNGMMHQTMHINDTTASEHYLQMLLSSDAMILETI